MGRRVWVPVVSGPLASFSAGFESWLRCRAYSSSAAADRLYQFDRLSRWLEREGLGVDDLTGVQAERFAAARRAAGLVTWASPQSVMVPLEYLRSVGVAPAVVPRNAQGPLEELLADYCRYLSIERGLCDHTVLDAYRPVARLFLSEWQGPDGLDLAGLSAAGVSSFLARECRSAACRGHGTWRARCDRCCVTCTFRGSSRRRWCGRSPRSLVWGTARCRGAWNPPWSPRCWPPVIGAAWLAGVTSRSCCCCRGWGYALVRSPRSDWMTSTGGAGCC